MEIEFDGVEIMYETTMKAAHEWVEQIQEKYASKIMVDVEKDESDCFHVFIETTNSISELSVSKPNFAPYRWVAFLVMDVRKSTDSLPVFSYYDKDTDSVEKIINQLNTGISISVSL